MSIPHRTNATASTSIKDMTTFFLAANAAVELDISCCTKKTNPSLAPYPDYGDELLISGPILRLDLVATNATRWKPIL